MLAIIEKRMTQIRSDFSKRLLARNSISMSNFYRAIVFIVLISIQNIAFSQITSGPITFDEIPLDKQLVARDSSNKGQVMFSGEVDDSPEYDVIKITVRKSGSPGYSNVYSDNLSYSGGKAAFSIETEIEAELSNFYFEIELIDGGSTTLIDLPDGYGNDVVAGDVFIIQGQSNAEATERDFSADAINTSPWIRVLGSCLPKDEAISDPDQNVWLEAIGDNSRGTPGFIGQWGLKLSNLLMVNRNYPIAIFNGARGGKSVDYFLENASNDSGETTNNYERLLHRLTTTGLTDKVKAIFWSQGENVSNSISNYKLDFLNLKGSWLNDYVGIKNVYIFQTINGCISYYKNSVSRERLMYTKEAQRQLAEEYGDIQIVNTDSFTQSFDDTTNNGTYYDYCHFNYFGGYESFANRIYQFILNDEYLVPMDNKYRSPRIIGAYMEDDVTMVIETDQSLYTNNTAEALKNFDIESSANASIIDLSIAGSNIYLTLSEYPEPGATISNLGAIPGETDYLIKNTSSTGSELLSFYQYDVEFSGITIWQPTWSNGSPNSSKNAIIASNYTLGNSNLTSKDLKINSGVNFDFDNGTTHTVSINGDLKVEGNMIIGDTESLIIDDPNADVNISGSFVKKEKTSELHNNYSVTYWSSPVNGLDLDEVFIDEGVDPNRIFHYDPSNENPIYTGNYLKYRHWFIGNPSDLMIPGKGFSVDGPGVSGYPKTVEYSFSGVPNFEDMNVSISTWNPYFDDSDITNLLGNPYPSAIDADDVIDANISKFDGTLYLWSHASDYVSGEYEDDYITYTKSGASNSEIPDPYYIASGQGFMILANEGSSTFRFENSMMQGGENDAFFKSASKGKQNKEKERDRIWLDITNDKNIKKQILIGFEKESTDELDIGYDGKLINREIPLTFYSLLDDEKYAVQGRGQLGQFKTIKIGFDAKEGGQYYIGISKLEGQLKNEKILLLDRKLKVFHDLKESDYSFDESEAGEFKNRFRLHFRVKKEFRGGLDLEDRVTIRQVDEQLIVRSTNIIVNIRVYDIMGRILIKKKPRSKEINIDLAKIKKRSIVIINMTLKGGKRVSKKIVIK